MTDVYGSNLNQTVRTSNRKKSAFVPRDPAKVASWWCPVCQLLVQQKSDPIDCAGCGGDMTIAPARMRGKA